MLSRTPLNDGPMLCSRAAIGGILIVSLHACGSASGAPPTTPNPPATVPLEITINVTATGFKPTDPVVAVGRHVIFENIDNRLHSIASNPFTTHADCPPINEVGVLVPGQSKPTGTLTEARVCGYHDTLSEGSTLLTGAFTVR